jgi:hypothetical protein
MSTITELMKGKNPGDIKVYSEVLAKGYKFFIPFYQSPSPDTNILVWYGRYDTGKSDYWYGSTTTLWKIYKEPVKMVRHWLWANEYRYITCNIHSKAPSLFPYKLEGTGVDLPAKE